MPLYGFRCTECGHLEDLVRSMATCTEDAVCTACTGPTRRSYQDRTNFQFKPKNYYLKPGDPGYDSNFEFRAKHTKQWEETALSRQKKYRLAQAGRTQSTGLPPEEGKPLSTWAEQSE